MVNISVVGLEAKAIEERIREHYPELNIVEPARAEFIVCYGGDGTFLYGEHLYPGVPKILLRNSMLCSRCTQMTEETILTLVSQREFDIVKQSTLEVVTGQEKLRGAYDITVGHGRINTTIRMRVAFNGVDHPEEIVGDGIVVSTPLGATGYYQSITRSTFKKGIGIAFNNSVNTTSHIVVEEDTVIELRVTRGPGVVAADNVEELLTVDTGASLTITVGETPLRLVTFREPNERFNFTMNRLPSGVCQLCGTRYE
jgi:NAD+ kinase